MRKEILVVLPIIAIFLSAVYVLLVDAGSTTHGRELDTRTTSLESMLELSEFSQQARLVSGGAGDEFANRAAALSGNTAIVSSSSGHFVFVRSGNTWTQQALLLPSDGLGAAAAIDGDTIVIGRTNTSIAPGEFQGAAYVFVRNGTNWTEVQRLVASDGQNGDSFGNSVAIDGETVIVGASSADVGANVNQGSAYVYVRNGNTWSQQAKLNASDASSNQTFGRKVAIDANTVTISNLVASTDAVYVFLRTGTSWSEQQKLSVCEPSGPPPGIACAFGNDMSISGDTLAIGNDWLNVNASQIQGGVYLFVRNGTVWSQEQRLTTADGLAGDHYGFSVSLAGNSLAVGAHGNGNHPGAAYLYERTGSVWSQSQPRIQVSPTAQNNLLGWFVSMSENRLLMAATRDQTPPEGSIGAAYIYSTGEVDPSPTPTPIPTRTPTPTPVATPIQTPTPSPTPTPVLLVLVSGRVTTPSGLGLRNAIVSLTNLQGIRQTATTSSFGVYSFANIAPGEEYLIGVSSKRYRFGTLSMTINGNTTNVDFVGLE